MTHLTQLVHAHDPSAVVTYDRLDWHFDSAMAAGQPPENAFTHIGFYLAWIIRHDLHNPELFPASHVAAVKRGEMTGSDLSDDIDTKLLPLDMSPEGRAFSDARYADYLAEYEIAFADLPDYAVVDDQANYDRIAPVLDALYASWVAAGRPKRAPDESDARHVPMPDLAADFDFPPDMSSDGIEAAMHEMASRLGGVVVSSTGPGQTDSSPFELEDGYGGFGEDETDPEIMSRLAPDLESLVPTDLTDPPLRTNSVRASTWGSSLLTRTLRRLDVDPKDASVVIAMGGRGPRTLTVMLYAIPGIPAGRLLTEVEPAITLPTKGHWRDREVAGRTIRWAPGNAFTVAFWARDGLVVHVAGSAEDVEQAVAALP